MRVLRQLLEVLGPAGVVAIGVLLFSLLFYVSGLAPLNNELSARQEAAERLKSRAPVQLISSADGADELRRFHSLFPAVDRLPDELDRIYGLARSAQLEIQQGEYRLESSRGGLLAYRLIFPVRGTYEQIRQLAAAALREMPIASLDALRFERKKIGESQLEAQLRLTIYFQPGGEDNSDRARAEGDEPR